MILPFTFAPNTTIWSAETNTNNLTFVNTYNQHTDPPATSHPLGILLNNSSARVRFRDNVGAGGNAEARIYQDVPNSLILDASTSAPANAEIVMRFNRDSNDTLYFAHDTNLCQIDSAIAAEPLGLMRGKGIRFYDGTNTRFMSVFANATEGIIYAQNPLNLFLRTNATAATYHMNFLGAAATCTTNCNFYPASDLTGAYGTALLRYNNNHTDQFFGNYNAGPDVADRLWPHPDYKLTEEELDYYTEKKNNKRKFKIKKKKKKNQPEVEEYMGDTIDPLSTLPRGTVVVWTEDGYVPSSEVNDTALVGVISTEPGVKCGALYTEEQDDVVGDFICLGGRIPCRVKGEVNAKEMLTTGPDGCAVKATSPTLGAIVGKALENKTGTGEKTIWIWVGNY